MLNRIKKTGHGIFFWFSIVWLILTVACAFFAGLLPLPAHDHMDWENLAVPPGTVVETSHINHNNKEIQQTRLYLLGTDTLGRDIFTRLILGTRISITVGLLVPCIGLLLGGMLGLLAGYYQGKLEAIIMAAMDTILAFPGIVLLLAITFYLGNGLSNIVIALGILVIPAFTRVARANVLKFARCEFVQAARMMGHKDIYIMGVEILPNIIIPLMAYALMVVAYMIMAEGMLSFLGLSVSPPTPSWGGMIAEGKEALDAAPHITLLPSLIMFFTVFSFNLLGDHLRSRVDVKEAQL